MRFWIILLEYTLQIEKARNYQHHYKKNRNIKHGRLCFKKSRAKVERLKII